MLVSTRKTRRTHQLRSAQGDPNVHSPFHRRRSPYQPDRCRFRPGRAGLGRHRRRKHVDDTFLAQLQVDGIQPPTAARAIRPHAVCKALDAGHSAQEVIGARPGDRPEHQERQDILRRRRVGLLPAVRHHDVISETTDAGTPAGAPALSWSDVIT